MRRRLFWSLVAVAMVVLTVGGVAAAVLINRSVDRSIRTEFARQAEATARLIESVEGFRGGPQGQGPGRGQQIISPQRTLAGLLAIVEAVGGHEYVEAAYVSDNGTVTPLLAEPVLIDQVPDLARLRGRYQFDATGDGGEVAALAVPVDVGQANEEGERGRVVVVIGTNLDLVPWTDVLLRFGWAIALGVVLAALIAARLSIWLASRLQGLRAASVQLAGGDLSARVPIEGHDEVTEVAVAFNEMAEGLEGARRREREFLANISHDLRTPLTTIAGYAEAIHEGLVPDGELERVGGVIDRESNRLSRLVEDLMHLSRIEAREFTLRFETVDLTGHLQGIVDAYTGKAESSGIALVSDLALLPEAEVDPDRVAQMVGNLIDNALRYTPDGGTVTVSLEARAGGVATIAVADTGPGIAAEDLPHIFERLYVAQRYRATRPTGSGLGLAIVQQLAVAMGGRAEVRSEIGVGTTVSVTVPVAPAR
ncbi:MAG TPA: HAMP domain-containing sensor histidine kinase [Acidimicrobiia bacterium]|nr:HAMP domain-containing sensor histidine kinase [Acidimicrobiia bacterium]